MQLCQINAETKLCAVIGNPIKHSMSPAIHNAAFAALHLNYIYLAFEVSDLEKAVAGMRGLNICGLSVTIPHKVKIMPYLDEIDPIAENIGSVNTVINKQGKLIGSNSDGIGAYKALTEAGINLDKQRILILGSGGAARSIAFTLAAYAPIAQMDIVSILPNELEELVENLQSKTTVKIAGYNWKEAILEEKIAQSDILINCTPLGMHPKVEDTPVPKQFLKPSLIVFDIVYTPLATRLITEAQLVGCKVIPGIAMFVNQAVVQFELWTQEKAPVEVMQKVVYEKLQNKEKH